MRIWLCLGMTILLLTSCGTNSRTASPSPNNQSNTGLRAQSSTGDNQNILTKGTMPAEQRQVYLEELAARVPGVNGAHCVVMGKTAIVGIDVDAKLERARVGSIKYTVAEALRKDPQGAGAIVTADIDLNQRLMEIGDKIRSGHPVSGFATELADMMGRIVPQLPSDTVPRTQNPSLDQSNNRMNMAPGANNQGQDQLSNEPRR